MATSVNVRLFARLRELCGVSELWLELPDGADAEACFAALAEEYPGIARLRQQLAVAINEEYSDWDRVLTSGDEVTFILPVSGGAAPPDELIRVTEEPIAAARLRELVASPDSGAIATFEGTVRDHTGDIATAHLEYEAHAQMAERVFREIAAEAHRNFSIDRIAIHHRLGRLEVGEVSVAIAVSSEHRAHAFAACRFAIDRLKVSAPIWKKEVGPDGASWVEGPQAGPVSSAGD